MLGGRQNDRTTMLDINNLISLIAATIFNVTLIYLAFRVKNKEMRIYKWIISIQACLELISAALIHMVKLRYCTHTDSEQLTITGTAQYFPRPVAIAIYIMNEGFVYLLVIFSPVQFIFRYWQLQGKITKRKRYFAIVSAFAVLLILALYMHVITRQINTAGSQLYASGFEIRGQSTRYDEIVLLVFFIGGNVVPYGIVIYCAYKSIQIVSEKALSSKTKSLQNQLALSMCLQTCLPLIFDTLPAVIFYILYTAFGIYSKTITRIMAALHPWERCLHPALCIVFVRPMRTEVTRILKCGTAKQPSNKIFVTSYRSKKLES